MHSICYCLAICKRLEPFLFVSFTGIYYYELFGVVRIFSNRTRAHIHQTLRIRISGYFFKYSSRTECVVFFLVLFYSVTNWRVMATVFVVVLEWRRVTRVRLFIGFVFTTQKHTHTHAHTPLAPNAPQAADFGVCGRRAILNNTATGIKRRCAPLYKH